MGEKGAGDGGEETESYGEYAGVDSRVEAEGAWQGVEEVPEFQGDGLGEWAYCLMLEVLGVL